jgi:hypothetical protein
MAVIQDKHEEPPLVWFSRYAATNCCCCCPTPADEKVYDQLNFFLNIMHHILVSEEQVALAALRSHLCFS